jgi:uncharacterized lipoprotein YmbA
MKQRRTTGWAAGCIVALTLAGCRSAPTRIYSLEPIVPASRIDAYRAPALRVDTVSVPAGWERVEILTPSAAGALEISDFDHWTAPLTQMVRQTLSDDLDRRLPPGSVIYPRLPRPTDALGVNVDILDFTIDAAHASMRASWVIGASGNPQGSKRSVAELRSSVSSETTGAVVRAWSDLIGQLADRIAADGASFGTP